MKLAVVGSRSFTDYSLMVENLSRFRPTVIVSGGCPSGADHLAERYANEYGIPLEIYPAEWNTHGKSAGMIRNALIVSAADWVIAFWDFSSNGTRDTIKKAKAAGKPLTVINTVQPQYQLRFD